MQTIVEQNNSIPVSALTEAFSVKALFIYVLAPFLSSVLMILFAANIPWHGGLVPSGLAIIFWLTIVASAYALIRAYRLIRARGLHGSGAFLWYVAILVSFLLTIDTSIFGSFFTNKIVSFPGSDILISPNLFFLLIVFQTLYFFITALSDAFVARREKRVVDWYAAAYAAILSVNTAAIIIGPLFIGSF